MWAKGMLGTCGSWPWREEARSPSPAPAPGGFSGEPAWTVEISEQGEEPVAPPWRYHISFKMLMRSFTWHASFHKEIKTQTNVKSGCFNATVSLIKKGRLWKDMIGKEHEPSIINWRGGVIGKACSFRVLCILLSSQRRLLLSPAVGRAPLTARF